MTDAKAEQKLKPMKYGLGVGGLALFGTGGCLIWTVVLIPVALPLAVLGLLMAVASLFIKTEPLVCPACDETSKVEKQVNVVTCPHCEKPIKRTVEGWVRVT